MTSAGSMAVMEMTAVARGETEGRTEWVMSCTRPPVIRPTLPGHKLQQLFILQQLFKLKKTTVQVAASI